MGKIPDPLADVVFLHIPDELAARFPSAVPPSLLIPCEQSADGHPTPAITLEAIIAGMLRVLIYRPEHPDASVYAAIVRALRPSIKEEFTQAGKVKASKKDFPIAIEIFQALAALFPDDPVCAFNLALVYHDAFLHEKQAGGKSRRPEGEEAADEYAERAFSAYRSALSLDEVFPDTYLNYGFFLLEQENYEKALAAFDEYLRRETDDRKKAPVEKIVADLSMIQKQDLLFKEAFDDITMGREEDGIKKAEAVLNVHPDFWNGWFLLGWGLRRLGRYREAKEAFLKALPLAPPTPDLLNELAIVQMELGELEESRKHLSAAQRLEPENVKVLSNLGVVNYMLNRPEEAAGFFRNVLMLRADDAIALSYLKKLEKK